MNRYIPITAEDKQSMLQFLGLQSIDDLFQGIPEEIRLNKELNLNSSQSEPELIRDMKGLALKNQSTDDLTCFLGAGAYDRYVPSIIKHLTSRSEFYTAYTPYQPEISQGTLQAIFEFQTMICNLLGMDVANASMYDGPSACAEAMFVAARHTRRKQILISAAVHPDTKKVVNSYAKFNDLDVIEIDALNGVTDLSQLEAVITKDSAAIIVQNPNFFGLFEDIPKIADIAHSNKALMITSVLDPVSLALTEAPGTMGADIAVGEGQSFGLGLQFGGPYLGFMAVKNNLMRKMPGRLVGETTDENGKRAFVLTLQAREQHIRREKATSNICSNQGLNALAASIYMSTIGPKGLKDVAKQSMDKAHYLMNELKKVGITPLFDGPFFDEFVVTLKKDADEINSKMLEYGFLGGYALGDYLPEAKFSDRKKTMLLCTTEKRTKSEIDAFVSALAELNETEIDNSKGEC